MPYYGGEPVETPRVVAFGDKPEPAMSSENLHAPRERLSPETLYYTSRSFR